MIKPFKGNYPVTFPFGAKPTDEEVRKQFDKWGIATHSGIDFGLPQGTKVLAASSGTVIQAGENGDLGICVIIKHRWGQSFYAHLRQVKVAISDKVKAGGLIGLSGKTGVAFGEHLHFGIKIREVFTDPSPYLKLK